MTATTYTEAELEAAVTTAVTTAVGDLRTQIDQLRASQEAAAVEERIATAVTEAVGPLTTQVAELQASLDAAVIEVATEKARAEGLELAQAEAARAQEVAARRDDRLAKVKEATTAFDEEYLAKNVDRWAAMDEAAFDEMVAEYAVLAGKAAAADGVIPSTTALTAAVQDRGATTTAAAGRTSTALRELGNLRRSGVDIRKI